MARVYDIVFRKHDYFVCCLTLLADHSRFICVFFCLMHSDNVIIGQTCTALCKRRLSILCKWSLPENSSHVFCWIIAKLFQFGQCTVEYPSGSNCTKEHAMKLFITTICHFGFTDSIQASMIKILHFESAENRVYIHNSYIYINHVLHLSTSTYNTEKWGVLSLAHLPLMWQQHVAQPVLAYWSQKKRHRRRKDNW